ncbi:MAG: MMPL family transporter, partial [Fimbriimonadaceae bacterium]|nr:MMPL family transporter [Alphaproteobacteria bacterium]
FLAALTTMISFLCLNFSDSPPFRQLGNLVAVGILITFILAFTLLPALTTYLLPKPANNRKRYEAAFGNFGVWVTQSKYFLIFVFIVTAAISGWGLSRLVFDDNFARYFSERFEFRRSTDFVEKNLSGITVIDFSVPAENGVTDPDYLRNLTLFTDWLRDQSNVTYVSSFSDIIAAASAAIPFVETEDGIPVSKTDGDMVWNLIQQNTPADMPPGRPVSEDNKFSIVTVILSKASSVDIRALSNNAETWLLRHAPALEAPATGMAMLAANMSSRNTRAMVTGTVIALALVSVILLISLRSFRQGFISLIPNIMPMIIAYGIWGILFREISFAATVVSAMTFGIVVDDTVHFLWKYRYARTKLGLSPEDAIPQSFSTVGVAILVTTLSVVSGFAALAFSGFLVNAHLGGLTVMTLVAALSTVLLFLPPFLLICERRRI